MRQFLTLSIAALLGGFVALAVYTQLQPATTIVEQASPQATYTSARTTVSAPIDFKKASQRSTPAVVQIHAAESADQVRKRRMEQRQRDPFYDFFGNDFFGNDFFGYGSRPKNGSGSGVILSSDGYIVTNNHVVGFADDIKVTLESGKQYKATKIGVDALTDLAVIKIEGDGLPTIPYGDSDKIAVGEWVLAVGNPFSYLTSTVTAGIVSAKGRNLDLLDNGRSIVEFIQTDAAVNPGNSGGALVNTDGELVGINTAIATPTGVYAGYSFAIPSNLAKEIVASLIENGDIRGGTLGIEGYDVDNYIVREYGLQVSNGFLVMAVVPEGNADEAGIKTGDVILAINDTSIYDFNDLKSAMELAAIGEEIDIVVNRKGATKTLSVRLKKNN